MTIETFNMIRCPTIHPVISAHTSKHALKLEDDTPVGNTVVKAITRLTRDADRPLKLGTSQVPSPRGSSKPIVQNQAVPISNLTKELLFPGELIKDRWRITRKLGGGGFGEIYEAVDTKLRIETPQTPDSSFPSKRSVESSLCVACSSRTEAITKSPHGGRPIATDRADKPAPTSNVYTDSGFQPCSSELPNAPTQRINSAGTTTSGSLTSRRTAPDPAHPGAPSINCRWDPTNTPADQDSRPADSLTNKHEVLTSTQNPTTVDRVTEKRHCCTNCGCALHNGRTMASVLSRAEHNWASSDSGISTTLADIADYRVAVKVESNRQPRQVLRMEVAVLRRLQGKSTMCELLGCGKNTRFNYMVMTLQGRNLAEVRRILPNNIFSMGTALRLTAQCLDALHTVHDAGFLHRDIKPSNFALQRTSHSEGRVTGPVQVVILDFGLARPYTVAGAGSEVRNPRPVAGFRGTVRYASVNAHEHRDLARRDDLWSLFYMLVEFVSGQLPWRRIRDKELVGQMKLALDHSDMALKAGLPNSIVTTWTEHLKELEYRSKPDYGLLGDKLLSWLSEQRVQWNDTYDWEKPPRGNNANLTTTINNINNSNKISQNQNGKISKQKNTTLVGVSADVDTGANGDEEKASLHQEVLCLQTLRPKANFEEDHANNTADKGPQTVRCTSRRPTTLKQASSQNFIQTLGRRSHSLNRSQPRMHEKSYGVDSQGRSDCAMIVDDAALSRGNRLGRCQPFICYVEANTEAPRIRERKRSDSADSRPTAIGVKNVLNAKVKKEVKEINAIDTAVVAGAEAAGEPVPSLSSSSSSLNFSELENGIAVPNKDQKCTPTGNRQQDSQKPISIPSSTISAKVLPPGQISKTDIPDQSGRQYNPDKSINAVTNNATRTNDMTAENTRDGCESGQTESQNPRAKIQQIIQNLLSRRQEESRQQSAKGSDWSIGKPAAGDQLIQPTGSSSTDVPALNRPLSSPAHGDRSSSAARLGSRTEQHPTTTTFTTACYQSNTDLYTFNPTESSMPQTASWTSRRSPSFLRISTGHLPTHSTTGRHCFLTVPRSGYPVWSNPRAMNSPCPSKTSRRTSDLISVSTADEVVSQTATLCHTSSTQLSTTPKPRPRKKKNLPHNDLMDSATANTAAATPTTNKPEPSSPSSLVRLDVNPSTKTHITSPGEYRMKLTENKRKQAPSTKTINVPASPVVVPSRTSRPSGINGSERLANTPPGGTELKSTDRVRTVNSMRCIIPPSQRRRTSLGPPREPTWKRTSEVDEATKMKETNGFYRTNSPNCNILPPQNKDGPNRRNPLSCTLRNHASRNSTTAEQIESIDRLRSSSTAVNAALKPPTNGRTTLPWNIGRRQQSTDISPATTLSQSNSRLNEPSRIRPNVRDHWSLSNKMPASGGLTQTQRPGRTRLRLHSESSCPSQLSSIPALTEKTATDSHSILTRPHSADRNMIRSNGCSTDPKRLTCTLGGNGFSRDLLNDRWAIYQQGYDSVRKTGCVTSPLLVEDMLSKRRIYSKPNLLA